MFVTVLSRRTQQTLLCSSRLATRKFLPQVACLNTQVCQTWGFFCVLFVAWYFDEKRSAHWSMLSLRFSPLSMQARKVARSSFMEPQKCFFIDDDYYHRKLMGNRFFTATNEHGEADEYDRIMRRTQSSSKGICTHTTMEEDTMMGDVDDYDHRIFLQSPHSSSASTNHQPH